MKAISVSVSEDAYEAFRRAAKEQDRSIAQLIREAMEAYCNENLAGRRKRVEEFPVFAGHRQLAPLPSRAEIYDEMLADDVGSAR